MNIILLTVLFAVVVYTGATGKRVALLSSVRLDILVLVVIGMTICSQVGIGQWQLSASGRTRSRSLDTS